MEPLTRALLGQAEIWWYGFNLRMEGLTDSEYRWHPVADAFDLNDGEDGQLYYAWPPGSRGEAIPPVTTIAWRMAHVALGCFGARNASHFAGPAVSLETGFPSTAAEGFAALTAAFDSWRANIEALGDDGLWRAIGPAEHDVEVMQLGKDDPFIGLIQHIHRELMHHGAEIMLLRDLYRAKFA